MTICVWKRKAVFDYSFHNNIRTWLHIKNKQISNSHPQIKQKFVKYNGRNYYSPGWFSIQSDGSVHCNSNKPSLYVDRTGCHLLWHQHGLLVRNISKWLMVAPIIAILYLYFPVWLWMWILHYFVDMQSSPTPYGKKIDGSLSH